MDAPVVPSLVLEIENRVAEFAPSSDGEEDVRPAMTLGKDTVNDFVSENPFSSRSHARIEFQHNDFFLVDHSTNGCYVQTEDEQVTHVHRGRLRLWGAGWISLGSPLHVGTPIHFRQGD